MAEPTVHVDELMRELGGEISRERRERLLARGGAAEYRDPELYARVEAIFTRVLNARDRDELLLPRLLDDEDAYTLQSAVKFSSHRPAAGPFLLFIKRSVLLPINRWLYNYSRENFERQQRINRLLFACIEELAIENARLQRDVAAKPGERNAGQPA